MMLAVELKNAINAAVLVHSCPVGSQGFLLAVDLCYQMQMLMLLDILFWIYWV